MANVMNLKEVRNKPHRSDFDLSSKIAFTAKAGELLPIRCIHTLPGDRFKFKNEMFTRTVPINTSAYVRLREYVDFYFVPYRLLWDKFTQYITQTNDPHYAQSVKLSAGSFSSHPYFTDADLQNLLTKDITSTVLGGTDFNYLSVQQQSYKLLEYLGYAAVFPKFSGTVAANGGQYVDSVVDSPTALNPFRLLAYQKIYNDWYRDSQWEASSPWTYNLDYIFTDSQLHIDTVGAVATGQAGQNMFTLRYANYKKDRIMGIQPTQQFGSAAFAGPLVGNLGVVLPYRLATNNTGLAGAGEGGQIGYFSSQGNSGTFNEYFELSSKFNTSGISVLAIRQAECLQKWKEVTLSGSKDYRDQIAKHWGVTPSHDMSDLCRRIGGFTQDINISEVVNTNLAESSDAADIAGKGIGSSRDSFDYEVKEYGIIMGIYHCVPLLDFYDNVSLDKELLAITAEQYPIPELDSIGLQEVTGIELGNFNMSTSGVKLNTNVVGYAPRYYEYKTALDVVRGGFLSNSAYANWTSGFSRPVGLSSGMASPKYTSFKVHPFLLNSVFEVQLPTSTVSGDAMGVGDFSDDQFLVNFMSGVYVARNLSKDGLPY